MVHIFKTLTQTVIINGILSYFYRNSKNSMNACLYYIYYNIHIAIYIHLRRQRMKNQLNWLHCVVYTNFSKSPPYNQHSLETNFTIN